MCAFFFLPAALPPLSLVHVFMSHNAPPPSLFSDFYCLPNPAPTLAACTPYGERLWGLLDPSAEAATQLRLGKDTKLSNHDLLGLVNEVACWIGPRNFALP